MTREMVPYETLLECEERALADSERLYAKLLQAKQELAEARELLGDAISGYVDVDPRMKWVDVQLHKNDLERIQDYLTRTEPKEAPTSTRMLALDEVTEE